MTEDLLLHTHVTTPQDLLLDTPTAPHVTTRQDLLLHTHVHVAQRLLDTSRCVYELLELSSLIHTLVYYQLHLLVRV